MGHVKLDRITKSFKGYPAISDLSLEIEDGQFFVLLGPTGAGKTTTLRLIAGLERANSGSISIDRQRRSTPGAPPSATWRSCCSSTRSTRATRCARTSSFR